MLVIGKVWVVPRNPLPPQTTIFFDMGNHVGAKQIFIGNDKMD